nr:hypothetical protein [Tanacetum cinerariifolium]
MGDEHLNTITETKSDEFIKSCVENLVPNPSESEGESECDMPARKKFTTFSTVLFDAECEFDSSDEQSLSDEDVPEKIFLNPLFKEEIIPIKIDQHHDNAESFRQKLILFSTSSSRLLYDNSSPRPPKEFVSKNANAEIESFSPSPIPNEDSDSHMDILILEELPSNYSLSLPVNESFYFDIPSFSRPPAKPPDGNTGILNIKIMGDNSEEKVPIPKLTITRVPNQEKSPNLLSHRGFETFQAFTGCPMMIHGKNIPILDAPLFHFYILNQLKYGGN